MTFFLKAYLHKIQAFFGAFGQIFLRKRTVAFLVNQILGYDEWFSCVSPGFVGPSNSKNGWHLGPPRDWMSLPRWILFGIVGGHLAYCCPFLFWEKFENHKVLGDWEVIVLGSCCPSFLELLVSIVFLSMAPQTSGNGLKQVWRFGWLLLHLAFHGFCFILVRMFESFVFCRMSPPGLCRFGRWYWLGSLPHHRTTWDLPLSRKSHRAFFTPGIQKSICRHRIQFMRAERPPWVQFWFTKTVCFGPRRTPGRLGHLGFRLWEKLGQSHMMPRHWS